MLTQLLLLSFSLSSLWLFLKTDQANDWGVGSPIQRRILSSEDDYDFETYDYLRDDYHNLYRHNDNNRFCCFQEDKETEEITYECDWEGYGENLAYIAIPGIVTAVVLSLFCFTFACLRRCNLCGGHEASSGCFCANTQEVKKYSPRGICCFKIVFIFAFLLILALTPIAWWGNQEMIDGTNQSGDDAVDAAQEVNDLANEVYEQAALVPSLDQDTIDLIQDAIDYSEEFLDDSKTFRDNMELANFWRNIVLCVGLSLLVVLCFLGLWAIWTSSSRCISMTKGLLIFFISILCVLLVATTLSMVVTSDFCWEIEYALENPTQIKESYIGYLMDCNEEDYPFAQLTIDLKQSQNDLVRGLCQGWSAYCDKYVEVICDTTGFDCLNDLTDSSQIYNRTVIIEDGNTYTIDECSTECQDDDLQSDSNTLNENLIGLDALNEIIVEVTPYLSCDWIYETLDEISNPTCEDAVMGGGYLSLALMGLIILTFLTSGCAFLATKRFDVRNHEYMVGEYVQAL